MEMIKIEMLSKKFDKTYILENLDLVLEGGCVYCLLGKNGVGKTTLIKLIADLYKPDSGSITILGVPNGKFNKNNLGMTGDRLNTIEEISGFEFLKLIGNIFKIDSQILDKRIDDLLTFFFENRSDLDKQISRYSTGMRKKIEFCAAVIHTPDILLLDEPFSGLDPFAASQVVSFLQRYKRSSRAIFISSHDYSYVEQIATHVGVLDKGRLLFDGHFSDFTKRGLRTTIGSLLDIVNPTLPDINTFNWI